MDLAGKKVLVTGASRGIGRAIARELATRGCRIVIHYHENETEAAGALREIVQLGASGLLLKADFNEPASVIQLGNDAWDRMDGIDFLINNAGVSYKKHFLDVSLDDLDHFFNINFKSTLLLTQTVTRKMVEAEKGGSVYTITSINGIQPGVGLSVYGATKGALETLMKGVALELAPHNIKINTIAVGAVRTDMNAAVWQDKIKLDQVNDAIPLNRFGQPEEIASVVAGLMASGSYMTGSTIVIDGGWMLTQGFTKPVPYKKPGNSEK